MRIRYTGLKPVKVIECNGITFVFSPLAEVSSNATLKYLLSADMKGLFVIDTPAPDSSAKTAKPATDASNSGGSAPLGEAGSQKKKKSASKKKK